MYKVREMKNAVYDEEEKAIYMVCNMQRERLGFFLLKFRPK